MSSCWEIISLKRNKVSQMVFDNMSQELCVRHTMCICTDIELFMYTYIQVVLQGVAFFFFFCPFRWVTVENLWPIVWCRTADKFFFDLTILASTVLIILISLSTFKCGEIPHEIPDFCFTSIMERYNNIWPLFLQHTYTVSCSGCFTCIYFVVPILEG